MSQITNFFKSWFKELPLDYQQGYQDGFNGCLKVMKSTIKAIGKLDVKNVQKRHKIEDDK